MPITIHQLLEAQKALAYITDLPEHVELLTIAGGKFVLLETNFPLHFNTLQTLIDDIAEELTKNAD